MMRFIGIDCGLSGAIGVIDPSNGPVELYDTPVIKVGKKQQYDIPAMVSLLRSLNQNSAHVGLEVAQAFPGQGVVSMFRTGLGFGIWQGIISTMMIPYTLVQPVRWKKATMDGMPKDKGQSIIRARQLYPDADIHLIRHHGRADALLIAEYLKMTLPKG